MWIGELSRRAGVSRDTIRYYEKLQLLSPEGRSASAAYKRYGQASLARLQRIQHLKALGFTLADIAGLLGLPAGEHPCRGLPSKIQRKVERIDAHVAELLSTKAALLAVGGQCDSRCAIRDGLPTCVTAPAGCC